MSSDPSIVVHHVSKVFSLGLSGRTRSIASLAKERLRHPIAGSGYEREQFVALDDVSFVVEPGEVVGLIGKNGAGKSTLLKILARITPPTEGHVEIVGRVGSLLEVGTGFHPELTGLENVYLNGTILGMSKAEIDHRLDEIVEFAGVNRFLDTPVKRYSSGMRVRLAFAVAAHLDADVLIVDEVLSVGDYAFQAKCLDKLRAITQDEGRTVLYVSHNLVTVEHLCPRSLLMTDGHVEFDGPTSEAIAMYLHLFSRGGASGVRGVFDLGNVGRDEADTSHEVLRRIELRPGGNEASDVVRTGDRLVVEIDVEALDAHPDALVHVTFGSATYPYIFGMNGNMSPLRSDHAREHGETIAIDVPSVPLTPGEYHIDVLVEGSNGVIDEVVRAAQFTVIPTDHFGTGYYFVSHDGVVTVPWEWELRPSSPDRVSSR